MTETTTTETQIIVPEGERALVQKKELLTLDISRNKEGTFLSYKKDERFENLFSSTLNVSRADFGGVIIPYFNWNSERASAEIKDIFRGFSNKVNGGEYDLYADGYPNMGIIRAKGEVKIRISPCSTTKIKAWLESFKDFHTKIFIDNIKTTSFRLQVITHEVSG